MKLIIKIICFIFLSTNSHTFENKRIKLDKFSINKYEVTIKEFKEYANKNNIITLAEKNGGGYDGQQDGKKDLDGTIKHLGKNPRVILNLQHT